jgi:hypothetical protein
MFGEYGPKTWFPKANGIKFIGKLGSLGQMGPSSPRYFTLEKKIFEKTCFLGSLGKMGTSSPRNGGCFRNMGPKQGFLRQNGFNFP